MPKFRDRTDEIFGHLTVVRRAENGPYGVQWLCRCICGKEYTTRSCQLTSGNVTSCGCRRYEYPIRTCSTEGCGRPHEARGLCQLCYSRTGASRARQKQYRTDNAEKLRAAQVLRDYNLSEAEYATMLEAQGGVCAGCGDRPTLENTRTGRLYIDHDHEKHVVRGLLCHPCNTAIGLAKDSPGRLRALADYLEEHDEQSEPGSVSPLHRDLDGAGRAA
jgi:Recombination endonuclease VII